MRGSQRKRFRSKNPGENGRGKALRRKKLNLKRKGGGGTFYSYWRKA